MSATQPLQPPTVAVDHAQLVAQAQGKLEDVARQVKAVALDLVNQHASAGLLRLVEAIRRQAILASLYVADLQNEATRQAYEGGAPLPPDVSLSGPMFPTSSPGVSQIGTVANTWNTSSATLGDTSAPGTAPAAPDAFLNGS